MDGWMDGWLGVVEWRRELQVAASSGDWRYEASIGSLDVGGVRRSLEV